jgi:hypothetical protein
VYSQIWRILVFSRHDHQFSQITKLKKEKRKKKKKKTNTSGKWKVAKFGTIRAKQKQMCPQKRQKRDGKEGSFPGREGSESQIKSSRKKKAAFAAVTCHKTRFLRADPKKKQQQQRRLPSVFFFLRPISIHRVIFHPISVHRVVPIVVSFRFRSPARARARTSARGTRARERERERLRREIYKRSGSFVGRQFPALAVISSLQFSL